MRLRGFGLGLIIGGIIQLPLAFMYHMPQPFVFILLGVFALILDIREHRSSGETPTCSK